MRVISLLSAIIVAGALYLLVFERDAVIKVSKGAPIETLLDAAFPTDQAEVNAAEVTPGDELTNIAETQQPATAQAQQKAQEGEEAEQDLAIGLRRTTSLARPWYESIRKYFSRRHAQRVWIRLGSSKSSSLC